MKITKLDENRSVTSTGYVIQDKSGSNASKPVGSIWEPSISNHGYRQIVINGKLQKLHRAMWETFKGPIPDGMQIDHINGNKLDNRLENLRLASNAENNRGYRKPQGGSSKYRGVSWDKIGKKWRAYLMHEGETVHCGRFDCEAGAAFARDVKAIELGWPKEGLNFFG